MHLRTLGRIFKPKRPRSGRVTIIESNLQKKIGPALAQVMALPYFDLTQTQGESESKLPDRCVISRPQNYSLNRDYDGLTIQISEIDNSQNMETSQCLSIILKKLAGQRQRLSSLYR